MIHNIDFPDLSYDNNSKCKSLIKEKELTLEEKQQIINCVWKQKI